MRDISSPLDGIASPFGQQRTKTLAQLLFASSEPGFTFEPWDITTLYQDRAGTTPVTAAGQSVGMRLSKDQGLRQGPELVTNGDFAAGNTGWTRSLPSWDATSGVMINDGSNATSASVQQSSVISSGKTYRVTFDFSRTSGSLNLWLAGSQLVQSGINTSGAKSFIVTSTVTGSIFFEATIGAVLSIDNISVRELAGNHEVAVSDAKRGVYGWMPKTGRRNLLTYTEQFDNAAWTKTATTVTTNAGAAPNGTTTADLLVPDTVSTYHAAYFLSSLSAGVAYTASIYAKASGYDKVVISDWNEATRIATFDLTNSTATLSGSGSTVTLSNAAITSLGNGWYRCSVQITKSTAGQLAYFPNSAAVYAGDGTSGILIWGAQLEVGSTATAYQRVTSQYDITEAGVPTCYYVQADGVDDAYVTPTITPNTDKVQVFAGMRKLSDAAIGMVCEFSPNVNTNAGTFWMAAPIGAGAANYDFSSKGTTGQSKSRSGFAAPHSAVLTGLGDISADSVNLRVNGNDAGAFGGDQGTGNYLPYPAYIYGRGGTSLPFNGLDFGHAVRFGPNLDAATIAQVESLIARNTPEVTL